LVFFAALPNKTETDGLGYPLGRPGPAPLPGRPRGNASCTGPFPPAACGKKITNRTPPSPPRAVCGAQRSGRPQPAAGAAQPRRGRHPAASRPAPAEGRSRDAGGSAAAVLPLTARRAPAPHLMTTRLPFTSTLSRVSLLERDMMAADAFPSAAARALPQPPPAPLAPGSPRPRPATIGPRSPPRVATGRAACPSEGRPPPWEGGLRREAWSRPARSRRGGTGTASQSRDAGGYPAANLETYLAVGLTTNERAHRARRFSWRAERAANLPGLAAAASLGLGERGDGCVSSFSS